MKICVSAVAPGLDSQVDLRFGRCQYLTIVDTDTMEFESIENSAMSASGGAGIQAAQTVADKGAEVVLTGNIGPNAFNTLQAAGIQVITGVNGKIGEIVEAYKQGMITAPASGPTVKSHFGMGGQTQMAGQGVGRGMGGGGMGGGRGMGGGMGRGRGGGQGGGRGRGRR